MASSQDDSEWDKSTSEIQSEDSDDLFESRPNRWRGPPQSWRTLTEEDRLTFNALERLRNQDLSVHLYNAFALKSTPIPLEYYQGDDADSQPQGGQLKTWAPPKSWTAWPLRADLVPSDDFMKRTEDEDEAWTFRKAESSAPSEQLEDVVKAAILRSAKVRFRKRQLDESLAIADDRKAVKSEPVSSENEGSSIEPDSEEEKEDVLGSNFQTQRGKAVDTTYKPAVATDDDLSYELIRPSTRAILSRLDQTLTVLHNARTTSYRGFADSTSSSSDAEDDLYNEATPTSRRSRSRAKTRSRPTSRANSIESRPRARSRSHSRGATTSPSKPKSNRGRKAASLPREGESEREFLRRRAKEQKKRRPVFSDEETTTAADGTKSPRKSRRRQARARSEDGEYWMQKKLDRFNLRDWSDIMGAAALAGFNPRVIERATQRCANLFGQGMEMHRIDEDTGVETRRYIPGQVVLSSDSEQEDENDQSDHHQTARSRAVPLTSSDDEEHDVEGRESESPRKRPKKSSSHGSGFESYSCHHAGCERAIRSFDRPANLRRHLKRVHGEGDDQERTTPRSEHGVSDKDVYYCTHADCERATRPFDKGHNLRRHLQRVHGEAIGGLGPKSPAAGQYFCPHAGCDRAVRAFGRVSNLKRHLKLIHGQGDPRSQKQSPWTGDGKETTEIQPPDAQPVESSDEDDSDSEDESSTESESGSESE